MAETWSGEFYCVKCKEKREAEGEIRSTTRAPRWPRASARSAAPTSTASSARREPRPLSCMQSAASPSGGAAAAISAAASCPVDGRPPPVAGVAPSVCHATTSPAYPARTRAARCPDAWLEPRHRRPRLGRARGRPPRRRRPERSPRAAGLGRRSTRWSVDSLPHLVVGVRPHAVEVGPWVVARRRSVRALRGRRDLRRGRAPRHPDPCPLPLLSLAAGLGRTRPRRLGARRDSDAPGSRSWSRRPRPAPGRSRRWQRHPYCGCAWFDGLTPADRVGVTTTRCRACPPSPAGGSASTVAVGAPPAVLDRRRPRQGLGLGRLGAAEVARHEVRTPRRLRPARRGREPDTGNGTSRHDVAVRRTGSCCAHPRSGREPSRGRSASDTSDRAGEGETRLLRGLLGLAAHTTGQGQLVATSQLLRLSQARGHLRACEFFMHEIHVVSSVSGRSSWVMCSCTSSEVVSGGAYAAAPSFWFWPASVDLLGLAGPASRPLARDHHALEEELAAPDAPRLTPFEGSVEAQGLHRAVLAQGLGVLHVRGGLGKPQLCVVDAAGQQLLVHRGSCVVQGAQRSLGSPRSCRQLGCGRER